MTRRLTASCLRATRRCVTMGLMAVAGVTLTPAVLAAPPAAAPALEDTTNVPT